MNEVHWGRRIREQLDYGLTTIDAGKLARLRLAREQALMAQKQPAHHPAIASVGHFVRLHLETARPRLLLAALTALVAAWLGAYWHADGLINELSDVDTALLADDMPVEALLDAGFESWLGSSH